MRPFVASAVVALVLGVASPASAEDPDPELRELIGLFDKIGLPNVNGKELVVFNTGGWTNGSDGFWFDYAFGWVLERSDKEITIFEHTLETHTYKIRKDLPDFWAAVKDKHRAEDPLPGETKAHDFDAFCEKFAKAGVKSYFGAFEHFARGGLSHGAEAALFAHWAKQRGHEEVAWRLAGLSRDSLVHDGSTPDGSQKPVPHLAEQLASHLRWRAISLAHGGKPIEKALEAWKLVATALPKTRRTDEAIGMVRDYERLIAEERTWKKPEDVAALSSEAKAAYWIHAFLDYASNPGSDPGFTDVVHRWSFHEDKDDAPKSPGEHLVALGWSALPQVIAHLDDLRPTRSISWGRSFSPGSYELLRVADCCQQVFEELTGVDLYEHSYRYRYVVQDGLVPQAVRRAKKWWAENGALGPRGYYARLVKEAPTSSAVRATRQLLAMDPTALGVVLERVARPDSETRLELLRLVEKRLGREHEAFLTSLLDDPKPEVAVWVACTLWEKASSDRGITRCLDIIDKWTEEEDHFGRNVEQAFWLLGTVKKDVGYASIASHIVTGPTTVRHVAIERAKYVPQSRLAEALVSVFDDHTGTRYNNKRGGEWVENRFCDEAAAAFAAMVGQEFDYYELTNTQRDEKIAALKVWWKENRDKLDWDALAKRPRK